MAPIASRNRIRELGVSRVSTERNMALITRKASIRQLAQRHRSRLLAPEPHGKVSKDWHEGEWPTWDPQLWPLDHGMMSTIQLPGDLFN